MQTARKSHASRSKQRMNPLRKTAKRCQRIGRRPIWWRWCSKVMATGSITRTRWTCRACSHSLRRSFGLWSKTTRGCSIRLRSRILRMTGNEDFVLRKTRLSKWEGSVSVWWILTMQMTASNLTNHWRQVAQPHRKSQHGQMQSQQILSEAVNWPWMHPLI